jgi:hypothetical protein
VTVEPEPGIPAGLRSRAAAAGGGATAATRKAIGALVEAVGALADSAIDRVLLTDERVTSASEARRLLAGGADTEALADKIQRVVVLAVPVVRMLGRGARLSRVPWVMVASLVAYRIEQATGAPADPALVKKVAINLYLHPKRRPDPTDDKLRLVRLTRTWVLRGAFGRNTSKRAARALDAAEQLDGQQLDSRWKSALASSKH